MSTECIKCGERSHLISRSLSLCDRCIKSRWPEVKEHVAAVHRTGRMRFGLPGEPPNDVRGISCRFCGNQCRIMPDSIGYCGLRRRKSGSIEGGTSLANVSWYHDPLPTNCVGDWVCAGGTGTGYPRHAHSTGPEYGYKNLAVFFSACSFDCLFCQNWRYRLETAREPNTGIDDLADAVDDRTSCICYFGGDPSPQLPFSIAASIRARARKQGRILRICWETNGSMHPSMLGKLASLSLESGGCIKFDLKAWDERLHVALCGVSNKQTLQNFSHLAELTHSRREPPPLIASTLLVPGYIDAEEVRKIAEFIARLSPEIPYSLLGFYPQFMMEDLPVTCRRHAERCREAALSAGLKRVHMGNIHLLLNNDYEEPVQHTP